MKKDLRIELRVAMLVAGIQNPEQAVDVAMDVFEKHKHQSSDDDRKQMLESKVSRIMSGAWVDRTKREIRKPEPLKPEHRTDGWKV